MKNNHIIPAILFTLTLITYLPATADATVVGSPHDFSTGGTSGFQSTNEDEICIFCHTPHGGEGRDRTGASSAQLPLWNRTLNQTATFNMYGLTSQTFDGKSTYINDNVPTGMSLLCLSCHDGVSSIKDVLNYTPDGAILMPSPDKIGDVSYPPWRAVNIGNDLRNDHPVSFVYDTDLVTADTTTRGGVAGLNAPNTISPLLLFGPDPLHRRLECPTCHEPHEDGSLTGMAPFLRMSNAQSAMCRKCHIK